MSLCPARDTLYGLNTCTPSVHSRRKWIAAIHLRRDGRLKTRSLEHRLSFYVVMSSSGHAVRTKHLHAIGSFTPQVNCGYSPLAGRASAIQKRIPYLKVIGTLLRAHCCSGYRPSTPSSSIFWTVCLLNRTWFLSSVLATATSLA